MLKMSKQLFNILSKKQKKQMLFLFFLMLISSLFEMLGISMILPLVSDIISGQSSQKLGHIRGLLIALALVFIFKNCFIYYKNVYQSRFIAVNRMRMKTMLLEQYLNIPYEFYLTNETGDVFRTISNDTQLCFNLMTSLMDLCMDILLVLCLTITSFVVNPLITLALIPVLGMEILLIVKWLKPRHAKLGQNVRFEGVAAYKWMLQSIQGIKSVKVAQNEDFFLDNYKDHAIKDADYCVSYTAMSSLPNLLVESISVSAVMLFLLAVTYSPISISDIIPGLSMLAMVAVKVLPCVSRISNRIGGLSYYEEALNHVCEILSKNDEIYRESVSEDDENKAQESVTFSFEDKLAFENISFAYGPTLPKIFDRASFEILKNQSVGIVGKSGAGKTTAFDLLLGLLKPDEGHIRIDGTDMEAILTKWRSIVAYVPQSVFLTDDTIRNNVAWGIKEDDIDDDKVWEALKEASLDSFVEDLKDGIESRIGENGIRLSGGQKQRLGIARALYKSPQILFFDEATSSLDNETESSIMEAIGFLKGKKTIILIAHRLSTTKNCDVIYCVEDGKVIKQKG